MQRLWAAVETGGTNTEQGIGGGHEVELSEACRRKRLADRRGEVSDSAPGPHHSRARPAQLRQTHHGLKGVVIGDVAAHPASQDGELAGLRVDDRVVKELQVVLT